MCSLTYLPIMSIARVSVCEIMSFLCDIYVYATVFRTRVHMFSKLNSRDSVNKCCVLIDVALPICLSHGLLREITSFLLVFSCFSYVSSYVFQT